MFSVRWVAHRHETQPIEVENFALQDLDKVVEFCQARFPEIRRKRPSTPPDGFLVFDDGHWLDRAENKTNNIVYHISDRPMTQEEWAEKWCK